MTSRVKIFMHGFRDTVPLTIAASPFGIVFGALAQSYGLSIAATLGMSGIVFAGASQFVAITLLASGAAFPIILLTIFVVNLRHMLYSVSLMPHASKLPQALRMIMGFWMTDETYAVVSSRLLRSKKVESKAFVWHFLGSAIPFYSFWMLSTAIGIFMGQQIPQLTEWGLDIAMVVAFVGIVVPVLRNTAQRACAGTAFISAIVTYDWPHQSGLLFSSLAAIAVGLILSSERFKPTEIA